MKRWGWAVAGLYALTIIVLALPVTWAAFWPTKFWPVDIWDGITSSGLWPFWIFLGLMVLGEILLLTVPVRVAERRLKSRRPLLAPVIASAFFMAVLVLLAILCLLLAAWGDDKAGNVVLWAALLVLPVVWALWGWLFHRVNREAAPEDVVRRLTAWLLRGSILELLVAVPAHIVVRKKEDCCAPAGTFLGIATGIAVMLMSFGPGVFWLFAARCRRLRPANGGRPESEAPPPPPPTHLT